MGKPLESAIRAAILAEAKQGSRLDTIAARYGVSKNAVSKIAIKAGFGRGQRKHQLTAEQSEEIVSRYAAGERTLVIAAAFGVSVATILETLRREGAEARHGSEAHARLPLRHDAFDVLSPEAAYWCGFIFTDGTIVHRPGQSPCVAIVLKRSDRGHLVKFRDFMGSRHAITDIKPAAVTINAGMGTGACRIALNSQRLARRLVGLGRYGPAVDPELAASRDFWRGCIDGDGTVGISCGVPQVKLVGSRWLLQAFVDFLGPISSRRSLNVRPARNIFVVSTSYMTAEKVVERLYAGAATALDRKAAAAAEIRALARAKDQGTPWQGSLWPAAG